jgi:hypothetical protein
MEKPVYNLRTSPNGLRYFFESVSDEKIIKKVIVFAQMDEDKMLYQLIFGNQLPNNEIDVMTVDDNQDREMILSTIISCIEQFFEKYPEKFVSFSGSTSSRNRLYRAVITKYLANDEPKYNIWGYNSDEDLEPFQKNHHYIGFIIQKKK